ncbi:MAG: hypothetical protein AB8B99_10410 [Phormidesmis sp.]
MGLVIRRDLPTGDIVSDKGGMKRSEMTIVIFESDVIYRLAISRTMTLRNPISTVWVASSCPGTQDITSHIKGKTNCLPMALIGDREGAERHK